MERFLASKTFAPVNWPREFKGEYLSLLQQFVYDKGSLMQDTLDTKLSEQHHYHRYGN